LHEVVKGRFSVSSDPEKLDFDMIHSFLTDSYWAKGISRDKVLRCVKHSLSFGMYDGDKQIGFARVITDFTRFAYLADVFILESYRNQGLASWLIECILAHPDLKSTTGWILATKDAHHLYSKFGFQPLSEPSRFMQLPKRNVELPQ